MIKPITLKIDHKPFVDLILEISIFISYLYRQNYINYQLFSFLDPKSSARIPLFYLLPQIHKPDTPGRPIISGCDSPTTKLSISIDYYLQPIVKSIPSYIQDITHFLRTLRDFAGTKRQNSTLVTFDVKSIYTNIPHDEGINYCSIALHKHYNTNLPIPLIHMRQLITFILKKNYFQFQKNFYLPPTMPTSLWTILNGAFWTLHPTTTHLYYDYASSTIFSRFGLMDGDSLLKFFDHMNTIYPTIKFEMSHSRDRIPF